MTLISVFLAFQSLFLLTRPLRDVTNFFRCQNFVFFISTHTPLTGRDTAQLRDLTALDPFLLTRPLRDVTTPATRTLITNAFLLTRPLRDVTIHGLDHSFHTVLFLLTRPLRDVTSVA